MRVLFQCENFWPDIGGAQIIAARLLVGLRERGHEFAVVTCQNDPALPQEALLRGIPVFRFPFLQALVAGKADAVATLRHQVTALRRTFAPDLVHLSGFGPSAVYCLGAAHSPPLPLLVTLHGEAYSPGEKSGTLLERILRSANWVAACSQAMLDHARRLVPDYALPASLVYNGMEAPDLPPTALPFDPPRILYLGRLSDEKGADLAVKAMALISERFPAARLVIAGDGPNRPLLERLAAELGIGHVAQFIGWVAPGRVAALMNAATLLVMPSRKEGFGLVALESALMCRPLVATRVGGLPEIVAHGETGILVDPEDSGALAEAVVALLENPDSTTLMGWRARRRAREQFDLGRCVEAYDALYQRLADVAAAQQAARDDRPVAQGHEV